MKTSRILIVGIIILLACLPQNSSSANSGLWEAGLEKTDPVYGISALISTPDQLLEPMVGDGVSNWVSTVESIPDGSRWIQAGWEFIPGVEDKPTQYVEVCPDYNVSTDNCGTSYSKWNAASQDWGAEYQYWVYKLDNSSTWCGFTGNPNSQYGVLQRKCYENLHGDPASPVNVTVRSESHDDSNNIDTTFDQILTKHVVDGAWYYLSNPPDIQYIQSPYNLIIINPYFTFRTFREAGNATTPGP